MHKQHARNINIKTSQNLKYFPSNIYIYIERIYVIAIQETTSKRSSFVIRVWRCECLQHFTSTSTRQYLWEQWFSLESWQNYSYYMYTSRFIYRTNTINIYIKHIYRFIYTNTIEWHIRNTKTLELITELFLPHVQLLASSIILGRPILPTSWWKADVGCLCVSVY